MTAEKQKYSDQTQHVWTKGYYLLGKSAKCHATHHIHYVRYFSWKPYEVGIASDLTENTSFRKTSHLPMITPLR